MPTNKTVKTAEEAVAETQRNKSMAVDSAIPDLRQERETVTIKEGTPYEYNLVLAFPGVREASMLREGSRNVFGQIDRTAFMEDAIKQIIVEPEIKSLDFWNTHRGFDEATDAVINFLGNKLN